MGIQGIFRGEEAREVCLKSFVTAVKNISFFGTFEMFYNKNLLKNDRSITVFIAAIN